MKTKAWPLSVISNALFEALQYGPLTVLGVIAFCQSEFRVHVNQADVIALFEQWEAQGKVSLESSPKAAWATKATLRRN